MPLPLIPIGIAIAAGGAALFGVKKGVDAHSDNKKARSLRKKAKRKFDKATSKLEWAREECNSELESLGELRFELLDRSLGRFVSLFREFRDLDLLGQAELGQLGTADFSKEKLEEMRAQSMAAGEVLGAGVGALGAGALAGMGSYGAATMFATASTGTAISTLSGVAATNATLAWFGGGSLAAGGLGIAGATAVLGGIVAGPVLAVGGMLLAAKARENLANARRNVAKAKKAASEMNAARAIVEAIIADARQFQEISKRLNVRFTLVLDELEAVIERERSGDAGLDGERHIDFNGLPEFDQRTVHNAWLFAQTFKAVLDAPLLTEEGAQSKGAERVLADGLALIGEDEALEFDGVWETTVNSPMMGAQKATLTLASEGNALTGTMAGAHGSREIENGKAECGKASWTANMTSPMPMKAEFSVAVEGDEISGNVKIGSFGNASLKGTRVS